VETLLRGLLWLLLGGWVGSFALFGLVLAPVVFGNFSGAEAGKVIGPVLTALHLYGAGAGLALAVLSWQLGRPRWLVIAPLVLAVLCAFSHFGITGQIETVRPSDFSPDSDPTAAARFAALHAWSMRIFLVISAAIVALTFLHARSDSGRREAA
jgi:hypothetical protein